LYGMDGLAFYRGSLIATQNGVNPARLVRLYLSRDAGRVERAEILEMNHELLAEPTLGVVVGDAFYYVATSQWANFGPEGALLPEEELRDAVVLKVKLEG